MRLLLLRALGACLLFTASACAPPSQARVSSRASQLVVDAAAADLSTSISDAGTPVVDSGSPIGPLCSTSSSCPGYGATCLNVQCVRFLPTGLGGASTTLGVCTCGVSNDPMCASTTSVCPSLTPSSLMTVNDTLTHAGVVPMGMVSAGLGTACDPTSTPPSWMTSLGAVGGTLTCVDGVWCANDCGSGNPNDCLACSVKAGAGIDGVCSQIAAPAHACVPSSGALPTDCASYACGRAPVFNDAGVFNYSNATGTCTASYAPIGRSCGADAGACQPPGTCSGRSPTCVLPPAIPAPQCCGSNSDCLVSATFVDAGMCSLPEDTCDLDASTCIVAPDASCPDLGVILDGGIDASDANFDAANIGDAGVTILDASTADLGAADLGTADLGAPDAAPQFALRSLVGCSGPADCNGGDPCVMRTCVQTQIEAPTFRGTLGVCECTALSGTMACSPSALDQCKSGVTNDSNLISQLATVGLADFTFVPPEIGTPCDAGTALPFWAGSPVGCVDGVICAGPCTTPGFSDCFVCSTSAGGSIDGVCTRLADSPACFDAGLIDAGTADLGVADLGVEDAGHHDDAGLEDSGRQRDFGVGDSSIHEDLGVADAGVDSGVPADAGTTTEHDAGPHFSGGGGFGGCSVGNAQASTSNAWWFALAATFIATRRRKRH